MSETGRDDPDSDAQIGRRTVLEGIAASVAIAAAGGRGVTQAVTAPETFQAVTPPELSDPVRGSLSATDLPKASEFSDQSWGAGGGLSPTNVFWEQREDLKDSDYVEKIQGIAQDHRDEGRVPNIGMQRWQNTYHRAQTDDLSAPPFDAWESWVETHQEYLGKDQNGNDIPSWEDYIYGWISPATPLKEADYPERYEGDQAYYADWLAERLGGLANKTTVGAFALSDFWDSQPHTAATGYFNDRMLADFESRTGISLNGSSIGEKASDIRTNHRERWTNYMCERWVYGWKAIAREVERTTGTEALFYNQTSFYPSKMRRNSIDTRMLASKGLADNAFINVQTLQPFSMGEQQSPAVRPSVMIGSFGAREPQNRFGGLLHGAEPNFWGTIDQFWSGLSSSARETLGWNYLKRSWLEGGFTHAVMRDGRTRRVIESVQAHYHDTGDYKQSWLDLLRNVYPTRPFGPAMYYSVPIEQAYENDFLGVNNGYLRYHAESWGIETPVPLRQAGAPFGCYVSDVALDGLADQPSAFQPDAWVIPGRDKDGTDQLPEDERQQLASIAPILSQGEAKNYDGCISFDGYRQPVGYAFHDQNGRLVVVVGDPIEFDETSSSPGQNDITVSLDLPDASYTAEDLEDGSTTTFGVDGGSGSFTVSVDAWDTRLLAVTPDGDIGGGGGSGGDLPSQWTSEDIGTPAASGSASETDGTFTVAGAGSDIWNQRDEFQYVHQSLSGDGTLVAQVQRQEHTHNWAKAGVMIRESLSAASKHATTIVTPGNGTAFQRRPTTGGYSNSTSSGDGASAPHWLKIERSGDSFTGYESADGSSWTEIGTSTISMASDVHLGLAVTSATTGTRSTAEFAHVSASGQRIPDGTYTLTAKHSGKAAVVEGGSTSDSADVVQSEYTTQPRFHWNLTHEGDGSYQVTNVNSGKALDVSGGESATSNGDNIQQWSPHGDDNQNWQLTQVEDGYYKVLAQHSGKCMDVSGVSTSDGASIHQWEYFDNANQKWAIEPVAEASTIGEVGTASLNTSGSSDWESVGYANSYSDPVLVMGPPTYNGGQESTVRARNVGGGSFETQIDEWNYLNGSHVQEDVGWAIFESGSHTLSNGTNIEAGSKQVEHNWVSVSFSQSFSSAPTVLVNRNSADYGSAVATRVKNVTSNGFEVCLQEEEDGNDWLSTTETVGWVAIAQGSGAAGMSYEAGETGDTVTENWHTISYSNGSYNNPVLLASQQSFDGGDPAALRAKEIWSNSAKVKVEEEQSADSETAHTTETVGYAVFDSPGDLNGS